MRREAVSRTNVIIITLVESSRNIHLLNCMNVSEITSTAPPLLHQPLKKKKKNPHCSNKGTTYTSILASLIPLCLSAVSIPSLCPPVHPPETAGQSAQSPSPFPLSATKSGCRDGGSIPSHFTLTRSFCSARSGRLRLPGASITSTVRCQTLTLRTECSRGDGFDREGGEIGTCDLHGDFVRHHDGALLRWYRETVTRCLGRLDAGERHCWDEVSRLITTLHRTAPTTTNSSTLKNGSPTTTATSSSHPTTLFLLLHPLLLPPLLLPPLSPLSPLPPLPPLPHHPIHHHPRRNLPLPPLLLPLPLHHLHNLLLHPAHHRSPPFLRGCSERRRYAHSAGTGDEGDKSSEESRGAE